MKNRWEVSIVTLFFAIWRVFLGAIEFFTARFIFFRRFFLGPLLWANFDGGHYFSIADTGYHTYQQAFFPLYPILISLLSRSVGIPLVPGGLIISHIAFFIGLIFFYKLAILEKVNHPFWSVIFLLLFPTSFFFASVYTESLFLVLSVSSVYFLKRKKLLVSGVLGMLASSTRLFGIFLLIFPIAEYLKQQKKEGRFLYLLPMLLIPLGLVAYMIYLQQTLGDPLAFFHLQPKFGAERSGGNIILLPQVLWRYLKILFFSSFSLPYVIAAFELIVFVLGMFLLWIGWKKFRIKSEYLIFSLLILLVPTMTGTLSSIPRYAISAFPLFFVVGNMHNKWVKLGIAVIFAIGLVASTALFLSGYFVA